MFICSFGRAAELPQQRKLQSCSLFPQDTTSGYCDLLSCDHLPGWCSLLLCCPNELYRWRIYPENHCYICIQPPCSPGNSSYPLNSRGESPAKRAKTSGDNAGTETARWTAGVREMAGGVGGTGGRRRRGGQREEMKVGPAYQSHREVGPTCQYVLLAPLPLSPFLLGSSPSSINREITTPPAIFRVGRARAEATSEGHETWSADEDRDGG